MALVGSYLDRSEFKARTVAPSSLVDGDFIDPTGAWTDSDKVAKRLAFQTFVENQLVIFSGKINARLQKRYAVPFAAPAPATVCGWLTTLVTPEVYKRRGWDPSDAQAASLIADAQTAIEEIKEAADCVEGLYDLPLRQDLASTSAIAQGGPLSYSEASPYTWIDAQHDAIKAGGE